MLEPEFDADGYPTEKTLAQLAEWPIESANEGLRFIAKAWHYPDWVGNSLRDEEAQVIDADSSRIYWRFATGGWSGNEDLVDAFWKSLAGHITWRLHAHGGLWIFEEIPS